MRRSAGEFGVVVLDSVVDIRTAGATQTALADALTAGGPVEIDGSGVVEADLTLIQLLLAARRTAQRRGTPLTLRQPATGALWDLLVRGGFIDEGGDTPVDAEFWMAQGA